jgi:L-amino acid N-acyltransferase
MPPLHLRDARPEDLGAIDAIYNHYVATSDCTLQLEPGTAGERAAWFAAQGALPVLVAEEEGVIVGWGALVRFQPRAGYRFSVEDSVYVRHDARGRGIGRALLVELIARARVLGAHCILGKITGRQEGSLALHAQLGFTEVGRLREVGFKFDRWVDVVLVQRML